MTRDDEAGGKPPPVPTEGDTRLWRQATAGDPPESQFSISDSDGGLEPGTVVDGFRVRRKLGQGGMGAVYLARDLRLGRKVALKLLRPETMGSQEARTTARFSHPHIVTIYAVGEHEGRPYVALEFLEGQTLRERIQGEQLGLKGSLRVALSIADALAEAHRHGVLHRGLVRDVRLQRPYPVRQGGQRLRVAVQRGDLPAFPHQPQHDAAPDTLRAAGDERPFDVICHGARPSRA